MDSSKWRIRDGGGDDEGKAVQEATQRTRGSQRRTNNISPSQPRQQLLTRSRVAGREVSEIARSGCVKAKLVGDGMDVAVDA